MAGSDALPLPLGVPGDLTAASSTLTRVADRVSQTQIYQHGGNAPVIAESWQGSAKESRVTEASRLQGRISQAAHRLPTIGTALTAYEDVLSTTVENVRRWQQQWDDAQDTYLAQLRRVNNQSFPEEDRQSIADGYADQRDAEHRRLLGLYLAAMEDLRTAGRNAATTVRGQCDMIVPPEAAGSRLEVGAHVLRDLPLSGGEAMSELADELAPELIDALRPAVSGGDPEALAAILEQYGQYADDPYFAHAVMSRLEAEGLMSVFNDLAIANLRYGREDALVDQQQEAMSFLGTLYATASAGVPRDGYGHEAMEDWRHDVWFPALIDSGRTYYELSDDGFAGGGYDGYWAQGLLLAAGTEAGATPGAGYMRHIGQDMVAWDRERGLANDTRDWSFARPFHVPNLLGIEDDAAFAVMADDPVHALLHAASQDPESTYALLNARVPGGGEGRQPIVEYLVSERGGTMAYNQPFLDQGELLAQTVAEYGADRSDRESTALAAHYLHAYIDTVSSGTFANGQELGEYAFHGARTGTADVIAAHIEDFVRTTEMVDVGDERVDTEVGDDPGFRILFQSDVKSGFARVFADLALDRPDQVVTSQNTGALDNPPALQRVLNAALAHNANELHAAFTTELGDSVTEMDRGAGFVVYLTESANLGLQDDADAQDAYNEYLKEVIGAGVGMVPVGDIPVVGKPAGAVAGLTTDAILDRIIDTDNAARQQVASASNDRLVRELLDDQAAVGIAQTGAWEPDKDPLSWAERHGLSAAETFVHDGELMPLEEIYANERRASRFNYFLGEGDGGAGAVRELTDQVEGAIGSSKDAAFEDYQNPVRPADAAGGEG